MAAPAEWLEPAFHPTYARMLCMLMRKHGVDTARLLAGTGLSWTELVSTQQGIDFLRMRRLIHAAMRMAASPSLGMEIGAAIPVAAHGPVGYAGVASRNVRQAFDVLVRYDKLRSTAFRFRMTEDDASCVLQIRERFDLGDVRVPLLEAALAVVVQLLETVIGQPLDDARYQFPYPEPAWSAAYAERLSGELRFGAGCMAIAVPRALLDVPCITADPAAYASARRDCEEALARLVQADDIVHQVRRRLQARDDGLPGCEEMAAELHMSARTLMRRLKQHGASYQGLLDDVRKEQAQWYLQHTSHSVESIAARLGYLDPTNFSRTFRRWFGVSPSAFRQASGSS